MQPICWLMLDRDADFDEDHDDDDVSYAHLTSLIKIINMEC